MSDLPLAFYGDDVTGSVDVLLQLARRGWRGRLFTTIPPAPRLAEAARECDAVGIAGIARSLKTDDLDAEVRPALTALAALSPGILQYKACSTADSSPEIGSLGRVIEIAREVVGPAPVPVLFAQPDFGRYTAFGHHFAREGGTVHRLDRQPTMANHPSTPMTESDLARHLSGQTTLAIAAVPFTAYASAEALTRTLRETAAAAVVLDALDDAHVALVGRAVTALAEPGAPVFVLGSGGLSLGIASARSRAVGAAPRTAPDRGPVLAVSGSRSTQTARQLAAAADAGWLLEPLPDDGDSAAVARAIDALARGRSVALTSDGIDAAGPGDVLVELIARRAADAVRAAVSAGATRRVIVCGGDTSGRVVRRLGIEALSIAAHPKDNIVLLGAHAPGSALDGLELLLKGGQVGGEDLFEDVRTGFAAVSA